ncbi:antibiotic biosynthesis monooxygenase family protein [Sphingomonas sp.]|uniref:antibiotic biosynthesis monooxygenase family protein n=1 Tax=Sphingomonas sp. TaxID=28214 RepID=UPI003B3BE59D
MIAVLFEVLPAEGERSHYLDLAADLLPDVQGVDGFLSIERFESLSQPGKLLSLSFWEDERAVAAWRNHARHRASQDAGKHGVFRDYRLRIAAVLRDYGMRDRTQAPDDSRAAHGG